MRARPTIEFTAWKAKIQNMRHYGARPGGAKFIDAREPAQGQLPPDPEGGSAVRPIYSAWNDKLKIARLPRATLRTGTFFVQRMYL